MLKLFLPNEFVKDVYEISPEKLKQRGVKGIITDLDNTLIEWDRPNATPKLIEWLTSMRDNDIKVTIISNNKEERVKLFSDPLQLPFIHRARKPLLTAFQRALRKMDVKPDEVVVIGDQLLTDILGGNRLKLYTILVVPVANSDGWSTRFNRVIEKRILNRLKRLGYIEWEEL